MLKFNRVSVDSLISRASNKQYSVEGMALNDSFAEPPTFSYATETGYHLYTEITLTLDIAAADDFQGAKKYLEVIQRMVNIADACCPIANGKILEVQGDRMHFFFQMDHGKSNLSRVLTFAGTFMTLLSEAAEDMVSDSYRGIKACVSHGNSILLSSGRDADDSLVSLGPCANEPAKHLPKVTSRKISMPTSLASILFPVDRRESWLEIDCRRFNSQRDPWGESGLDRMLYEAGRPMINNALQRFEVRAANIGRLQEGANSIDQPTVFQGVFMRSDLDGFTAKVQEAFESGAPDKLQELLSDFVAVMNYENKYVEASKRPVIQLPWAGDCSSLLLLSRPQEDHADMLTYLPAKAPANWHTGFGGKVPQPYESAVWLVSACAGADEESGNGMALLASVQSKQRKFLVAAGWSAYRSLDAHDTDGLRSGDTVISKKDYVELSDDYKDAFTEASSYYMRAGVGKLSTFIDNPASSVPQVAITETPSYSHPKPKPYFA